MLILRFTYYTFEPLSCTSYTTAGDLTCSHHRRSPGAELGAGPAESPVPGEEERETLKAQLTGEGEVADRDMLFI